MRALKKIQRSRVAPARRKVPNRNILTRPPRRTLTSDGARKLAGDGLGAERIAFFQRKSSTFIDELNSAGCRHCGVRSPLAAGRELYGKPHLLALEIPELFQPQDLCSRMLMAFTAEVSMKRVGIYLRVSTNGQTTENQRRELEAVAKRSGWQVVGFYEDAGISGAKGRDKRPAFDRLLEDATARKVDMIAAWSVDRLGRSMQHLVGLLMELQALKCDLYLHQQAIDTTTPSGRAMFQMCGVFAEFEREMIRERVNAGLARAKDKGIRLGRRPVKASVEARIRELRAEGIGILKIGRTLGVGTSVVQRVLDAAA
jgi:DNA invertase Pin-like site-specific DNA recombinase